MTVRTRFAPSPTGNLHIGGARTALYSWLYAHKLGGKFILRIEDTDRERSTQAAVDAILEAMTWLGLEWDEGPYYQTQHFDRYRAVCEQLLETGFAYRCYCSKERLEALREQQTTDKEKPRYDGHCRDLVHANKNDPHVIRFRNPDSGAVEFDDCVKGKVVFQNEELDDLILYRTDGTPTYNFTVVVDDLDMKITHVIRGDDHLNNTPRQINILKALGAELPVYSHIPMILGPDGKRLSKRYGAVSVQQYRHDGFLPDALLNYLLRLGWSHGNQEIFTREEMIKYFNLFDINKAPAALNPEKLLWLNQHYLKSNEPTGVIEHLKWHFNQLGLETKNGPALNAVVLALRERVKTVKEMAEKSAIFYQEFQDFDSEAREKHVTPDVIPPLRLLRKALEALPSNNWHAQTLHQVIEQVATESGFKLGKLAQPLRIAVTGGTVSPSIDATLELIGRERVLARLERLLALY